MQTPLRYSSRSSSYSPENPKRSGQSTAGLTDVESARAVARQLFESYDKDRDGNINGSEISFMISETYKNFNRSFNPSKTDVESYGKVLDKNKDGRISYQDIEEICVKYLVTGRLEAIQSKKEVVKRSAPPKYTAAVVQRLEVARRLFRKFDIDNSNTLTIKEVGPLLTETYKETMGIPDFQPSLEDVTSFMDLVDRDEDGIVNMQDYEYYILNSLKEAGIKIEEEQMKL